MIVGSFSSISSGPRPNVSSITSSISRSWSDAVEQALFGLAQLADQRRALRGERCRAAATRGSARPAARPAAGECGPSAAGDIEFAPAIAVRGRRRQWRSQRLHAPRAAQNDADSGIATAGIFSSSIGTGAACSGSGSSTWTGSSTSRAHFQRDAQLLLRLLRASDEKSHDCTLSIQSARQTTHANNPTSQCINAGPCR